MIAPPRADHGQTGCGGHETEPVGGKDLDVAAMADLGRPARAASDETVEREWLTFEGQHDVESTARLQDSCHLAQDLLRIVDVLQDVEDPDEIELAVAKGKPLRGRKAEIDSVTRRTGRRDRGAAGIATEHVEVRSLALDRLGDGAGTTPDVQHLAVDRSEVVEQVSKLEPVHEPGLGTQRPGAPALGLVIERAADGHRTRLRARSRPEASQASKPTKATIDNASPITSTGVCVNSSWTVAG